mmetsp:Transcript_35310/g.80806  ORF Transcript_35310/g.80806 Transcript_35310/m.80806 type:complete len:166 (-) Transcript_35310:87-584(-)
MMPATPPPPPRLPRLYMPRDDVLLVLPSSSSEAFCCSFRCLHRCGADQALDFRLCNKRRLQLGGPLRAAVNIQTTSLSIQVQLQLHPALVQVVGSQPTWRVVFDGGGSSNRPQDLELMLQLRVVAGDFRRRRIHCGLRKKSAEILFDSGISFFWVVARATSPATR